MFGVIMIMDKVLRVKPAKTLILLKKEGMWYASNLAKETDTTYAYMVKLLDEFEKMGIVNFRRDGRVKYVTLTELGMDIIIRGLVA